jgi:hypothetical protein
VGAVAARCVLGDLHQPAACVGAALRPDADQEVATGRREAAALGLLELLRSDDLRKMALLT